MNSDALEAVGTVLASAQSPSSPCLTLTMYSDTGDMAGVQERRTDLEEKDIIRGFPGAAKPGEAAKKMSSIGNNMVCACGQAIASDRLLVCCGVERLLGGGHS